MLQNSKTAMAAVIRALKSSHRGSINLLPLRRWISSNGPQPKTVMITGVTRGLGRALALEMARRGHAVIGCCRSKDEILALQEKILDLQSPDDHASSSASYKHFLTGVDVSSDSGIQELAKIVIGMQLVPDIIVNYARTIERYDKLWKLSADEVDMIIDTNIKGIANVIRHFLPAMIEKKQGVIVNMSSGWGSSEVAPYSASKWGIDGLTKSVALELPQGLAMVRLIPGTVASDVESSADLYRSPEAWAPEAAQLILSLNDQDNGRSFSV